MHSDGNSKPVEEVSQRIECLHFAEFGIVSIFEMSPIVPLQRVVRSAARPWRLTMRPDPIRARFLGSASNREEPERTGVSPRAVRPDTSFFRLRSISFRELARCPIEGEGRQGSTSATVGRASPARALRMADKIADSRLADARRIHRRRCCTVSTWTCAHNGQSVPLARWILRTRLRIARNSRSTVGHAVRMHSQLWLPVATCPHSLHLMSPIARHYRTKWFTRTAKLWLAG